MKDLRAIKGKYYLQRIIAEGEHETQDFKFQISDACKIAHSISAFANHSGGRLLIGVKDNGTIAGVRNEEDIYVVEQAAQLYCRPAQEPRFDAFRSDDGAVVIRVEIAPAAHRPVLARETDGAWRAYYRVADENIAAHPLMVSAWRKKASDRPALLTFSRADSLLLDALEREGSIDIERIPSLCVMSQASANDMVTRLYSMSVIDFRFIDRRFKIVASEPSAT